MHVRWNPLPGRFKDYIAMPKFNMYQSLHTTVLGPEGKPVELQIRTDEMHRRAEYGVAAHWKYKEGKGVAVAVRRADDSGDLVWVRQLLDWQRETADPGEFLDSLRFEINSTEVYVFTPKGDVISLPQGSTPVDFAYAIHTEVGTGHRRPGQRAAGAAGVGAGQRRRRGDLHLQGRRTPDPAATGCPSSRARGPGTRSGTTSAGSGATSPSRAARTSWPGRCARRACRCSGC